MIPSGGGGLRLAAISAPDFDLAATLGSGQVFHWVREGAGYLGAIGAHPVYVEQQGATLLIPRGLETVASRYFALDHPLAEIHATFPRDPAMMAALEFCRGLRLIRQPAWECVATFITSSMKQVAHIAQISHTMRRRFGASLPGKPSGLFGYPTAADLAGLEEASLRACGLGYRAKNLLAAARMVASGAVDLTDIARRPDAEARRELLRLPGVGEKVANCALLFGFERIQAFPIDVWIERVLRQLYFPRRRKVTVQALREFCAEYFGPFGGYAQQCLFHHARLTWPRGGARSARKK